MEIFLIIIILILVFIGIPIGIGFLLYLIPKNLGYPKTGKYLTMIFGLFVFTLTLMTAFEDQIFTKSDAKKLVEEQEILLTTDFELENNESMWAIGDYYQTFTLRISEEDKQNAIAEIKNSPNFKKIGEPHIDLLFDSQNRFTEPKRIQNYETEKAFVREYFVPKGQGYAPTFRRIKIGKKEGKLIFEDIDE